MDLVHSPWPSKWIACPGADPRSPAVYPFRKPVALKAAPGAFIVRVSADNRFVLFVNGVRVGDGPAQGDLDHWRYETYDIGPLLRAGDNILAATIWNCGWLAPMAQMSDQAGFLMQGDSEAESAVNTDNSWEVEREEGQGFQAVSGSDLPNYYAAPPGEILDGARYDWDWQAAGTSAGAWKGALTALSARMPHPSSDIVVRYRKIGDSWSFMIDLPRGVSGAFLWKGRGTPLLEGSNSLSN